MDGSLKRTLIGLFSTVILWAFKILIYCIMFRVTSVHLRVYSLLWWNHRFGFNVCVIIVRRHNKRLEKTHNSIDPEISIEWANINSAGDTYDMALLPKPRGRRVSPGLVFINLPRCHRWYMCVTFVLNRLEWWWLSDQIIFFVDTVGVFIHRNIFNLTLALLFSHIYSVYR